MATSDYREKLIDEVKKYPVLYDTSHENHRDIDIRDRCWVEIASRLGSNCEVVKREWKILRDSLRQSMRTRTGAPAKRWRFQTRMAFVVPHMTQRKARRVRHDVKIDELEQSEVEETPAWEPGGAAGRLADPPQGGGGDDDALDLFFASVCQSTRRLPRHLQHNVKRQVLDVLLRAEEEFYSEENKMDFKTC
ncbi:uncharacterized protein LOC121735350 [Aricia agestis]|uniref:uncharacterized protein LOC121735350 n=1 Tax=Aricia agestis TaxID=91739 RepID=UPI001C202286|nr:uncharacterized protein LOC121735350 [Aricia agestis]